MYEWLFAPPGYRPRWWDPARARGSLARAIGSESSLVLVAESPEGQLEGIVAAYLDLDSIRYGPRCWVEDLAVAPARRSAGVGKALLDAAKRWAQDCGATHLELDTGIARVDAQRFYEREAPVGKGYSYTWAL